MGTGLATGVPAMPGHPVQPMANQNRSVPSSTAMLQQPKPTNISTPAEYWLKHKELKANFLTVLQRIVEQRQPDNVDPAKAEKMKKSREDIVPLVAELSNRTGNEPVKKENLANLIKIDLLYRKYQNQKRPNPSQSAAPNQNLTQQLPVADLKKTAPAVAKPVVDTASPKPAAVPADPHLEQLTLKNLKDPYEGLIRRLRKLEDPSGPVGGSKRARVAQQVKTVYKMRGTRSSAAKTVSTVTNSCSSAGVSMIVSHPSGLSARPSDTSAEYLTAQMIQQQLSQTRDPCLNVTSVTNMAIRMQEVGTETCIDFTWTPSQSVLQFLTRFPLIKLNLPRHQLSCKVEWQQDDSVLAILHRIKQVLQLLRRVEAAGASLSPGRYGVPIEISVKGSVLHSVQLECSVKLAVPVPDLYITASVSSATAAVEFRIDVAECKCAQNAVEQAMLASMQADAPPHPTVHSVLEWWLRSICTLLGAEVNSVDHEQIANTPRVPCDPV